MALTVTRIEGDVMKVNAFLVRGPRGAALIDGMLTVSDARKVTAALDASGTEPVGVAITHPHPDHYAGLAQILGDREALIVATREVDDVIRRDDATKEAIVGPMMGPEWPDRRMFPNQIVTDGETVTIANLPLRVRSLGPGESFADTIWELDDRTVFAGDIAYNGMHAYLADGQWEHWLAAIDRLERNCPTACPCTSATDHPPTRNCWAVNAATPTRS